MSSSTNKKSDVVNIDQSRQEAVYGGEGMKKLSSAKVLISGLSGLGVEIAKNVILANVKAVTLHDTEKVSSLDLSSQFYVSEADLGKNRASSCLSKLKELNPSVSVSSSEDEQLSEEFLSNFSCVVLVGTPLETSVRVNAFCRSQSPPIAFIRADIKGLFGQAFSDFGPGFVCSDVNGEQPSVNIVAAVSPDGTVACVEEQNIDFQDGDSVTFSEIKGVELLNDGKPRKVKNVKHHSFQIDTEEDFSGYVSGGIVTTVKQPKKIDFKSLEESLTNPGEFLESDFAKFGRPTLLHTGFRALDAFVAKNGRLPKPACLEDANTLVALATEKNSSGGASMEVAFDEPSTLILKYLAYGSRASLNPLAAIFGGMVGQEVIKSVTGKFHPLFQWFYYDALEALPKAEGDLYAANPENFAPSGDRYDSQVIVWGKDFQEKLGKLNYFIVGAGALGCEFLKNFALMGVSCGGGQLTVTDDDIIESSNLTRQFLFRGWNIQQHKSSVAAAAAKAINPNFNVKPLTDRVSPNTEEVFDDKFWQSLSGVCNALDNVKARLYVDQRCVLFEKPLLESGTLGPKLNTQVVIPHKTENYGASTDPPEKEAPICLVHNFPHNIQHALIYGRSEFVGCFETAPKIVGNFLKAPSKEAFVNELKKSGSVHDAVEGLKTVQMMLMSSKSSTFAECVAWARLQFQEYFFNKISQLIFTFPKDSTTSTGIPFWSPPKRYPTPLVFDADDEAHMNFVIAAANLRAKIFAVEVPENNRDPQVFKDILKTVEVPEFRPQQGVKIQVSENEPPQTNQPSEGDLDSVFNSVPEPSSFAGTSLYPEEFEKDDETNFHMDFIGSVGNLRARNYGIKEVSKLEARLVAGKIIPAIATATAVATGFVMLELVKTTLDLPMESFRNSFVNLALPLLAISEPLPPKKVESRIEKRVPDPLNHPDYVEEEEIKAYPEGHTVWDKLVVDEGKDLTIKELADLFQEKHKINLTSLVAPTANGKAVMVWCDYMPRTKDRLNLPITQAISSVSGTPIDPSLSYILPLCSFSDDEGNDVDVPSLIYKFRRT